MYSMRFQILLPSGQEMTVNAGEYWGFTFTTGGVVTYRQVLTNNWCVGNVIPNIGTPVTLSSVANVDREYAIALGYSNDAGKN